MRSDLDPTGLVQMTGMISNDLSVSSTLRRAYRALRNLPDRLLHGRRHRAASRRLSEMRRPRSILVVCHGNICRSPYLEAVLTRALPNIRVTSAGFVGAGRPVPPSSLSLAAQRGLDLSEFRARPLAPASVLNVDLVIVMDRRQAARVAAYRGIARSPVVIAGDLDPLPSPTRAIVDPWQQPMHVFVASFDRLDRCAATLVKHLRRAP